MQYKKEHIKNAIISAAIDEFVKNGYHNAAIKDIADNAGITVGNIYRYFVSKKTLFDAVVEEAYKKMPQMIREIYKSQKSKFNVKELAKNIAASIMEIYNAYSKQIFILVYKSEGTKYSDFVGEIIKQVAEMIREELFDKPDKNDLLIANIIAQGFVNSLFTILAEGDKDNFQALAERLLLYYFYNIEERL
jgi:AcrR family transcriptional regulator